MSPCVAGNTPCQVPGCGSQDRAQALQICPVFCCSQLAGHCAKELGADLLQRAETSWPADPLRVDGLIHQAPAQSTRHAVPACDALPADEAHQVDGLHHA